MYRHGDDIQASYNALSRLLTGIMPDLNTPRFPTMFSFPTTIEFKYFPIQNQDTVSILYQTLL